jgi:ubiquinone/menaquinone biosynthesis C-methylase UbiE
MSADEHPLFARYLAWSAEWSESKGAADHRRRMLAGLSGRVIEVGVGSGINFRHYPSTVTEVVAVEPEPNLRSLATEAARDAPVPVRVVDGVAERLPADDASMDAGVAAGLLCSVPDAHAALLELARVIRPGGELRFYEHVVSRRPRFARLQGLLDATVWPRAFAGCHPNRDTEAAIAAAGFELGGYERFMFAATPTDLAVAPRILGSARRP